MTRAEHEKRWDEDCRLCTPCYRKYGTAEKADLGCEECSGLACTTHGGVDENSA